MYSNKCNVNILTDLMIQHGINTVVMCPGSRNTPLLNNFNESANFQCFSVTDERSAGFYALGLALTCCYGRTHRDPSGVLYKRQTQWRLARFPC